MNIFELIRYRRSIRKYEERQVSKEDLKRIIEAGLYAPNAGGGQRSMIVALRDPKLTDAIGKMNVGKLDRSRLSGNFVSMEQPCIIARGEETFDSDYGHQLMDQWGVPSSYVARCFVLLGYCKGDYPAEKPRREGRYNIIEPI